MLHLAFSAVSHIHPFPTDCLNAEPAKPMSCSVRIFIIAVADEHQRICLLSERVLGLNQFIWCLYGSSPKPCAKRQSVNAVACQVTDKTQKSHMSSSTKAVPYCLFIAFSHIILRGIQLECRGMAFPWIPTEKT